jgi:hypothetical protein
MNDERTPAEVRSLPGPDRKRTPRNYHYRLIYRNPLAAATGCVMLWEVTGGRLPYQIAWERTAAGKSLLHCTCADAVFRREHEARYCKHIDGLLGRKVLKSA